MTSPWTSANCAEAGRPRRQEVAEAEGDRRDDERQDDAEAVGQAAHEDPADREAQHRRGVGEGRAPARDAELGLHRRQHDDDGPEADSADRAERQRRGETPPRVGGLHQHLGRDALPWPSSVARSSRERDRRRRAPGAPRHGNVTPTRARSGARVGRRGDLARDDHVAADTWYGRGNGSATGWYGTDAFAVGARLNPGDETTAGSGRVLGAGHPPGDLLPDGALVHAVGPAVLDQALQLGDERPAPLPIPLRHLRQGGLERRDGLVARVAALSARSGSARAWASGSSSSKAASGRVIGSFRPAARSIRMIDRTAAMIAMIRSRRHPGRERGLE